MRCLHVFTLLGPLAHVQFVPHEMAFPFTLMSVEFWPPTPAPGGVVSDTSNFNEHHEALTGTPLVLAERVGTSGQAVKRPSERLCRREGRERDDGGSDE